MILEVERLNTYYGKSHILFDLSMKIDQGEIVVLLGRNGAGKTTTLRSIIGLTPPRSGRILYKEKEITGLPPYHIARLGIGFVPEDRRIFPELTVEENLDIGRKVSRTGGLRWDEQKIFKLFPSLERFARRRGATLSGGEQQMLTIARTLMGNPELLLLDEPSEGLAPMIVRMLANSVREMKSEGMTILLSEQNTKFALGLSDRAYVIDTGSIQFQGLIPELRANEEVKKRYLAV